MSLQKHDIISNRIIIILVALKKTIHKWYKTTFPVIQNERDFWMDEVCNWFNFTLFFLLLVDLKGATFTPSPNKQSTSLIPYWEQGLLEFFFTSLAINWLLLGISWYFEIKIHSNLSCLLLILPFIQILKMPEVGSWYFGRACFYVFCSPKKGPSKDTCWHCDH